MGPLFYIIVAVCLYGAGFGTAWKIDEWRHDAADKARIEAQAAAQVIEDKRIAGISAGFEKSMASLRANQQTNNAKVNSELLQKIYTSCVLTQPVSVQLDANADDINRALGLAVAVRPSPAPAPKPAGAVNNGGSSTSASGFTDELRRLREQAKGVGGSGSGSSAPGK